MASTSTNKTPLMVDRPFLRAARLTTQTSSYSNASLGSVVQLLRVGDLPSQDGAVIEDLWIQNLSYANYYSNVDFEPVRVNIYVFIPDAAQPGSYAIFPICQVDQHVTIGTTTSERLVVTGVSSNVYSTAQVHGLSVGSYVQFASTFIYPGLEYGKIYIVTSVPANDTFTVAGLDGSSVSVSNSTTDSTVVKVPGSLAASTGKLGSIQHIKLPYVMCPVPRFAEASPVTTNKFQGLYLEKGHILGAAIDTGTGSIVSAPSAGETEQPGIGIYCQGGFF